MPFNGSGVFSRVHDWAADKLAGIKVTSSRFDAENDDFANALNNCVTRDGQGKPTADLVPSSTDTYDLGTDTTRWKDAYLEGDADIDGNADIEGNTTVGGTLSVTGTSTLTGLANLVAGLSINGSQGTIGNILRSTGSGTAPDWSTGWSHSSQSANFNITSTSNRTIYTVDASGGNVTATVQVGASTAGAGFSFIIKKTDNSTNTVTITPSLDNIDGVSNFVIREENQAVRVFSDGSDYQIGGSFGEGSQTPTIQVITATGTYSKPAGLKWALFLACGGGGGGAGETSNNNINGSAGSTTTFKGITVPGGLGGIGASGAVDRNSLSSGAAPTGGDINLEGGDVLGIQEVNNIETIAIAGFSYLGIPGMHGAFPDTATSKHTRAKGYGAGGAPSSQNTGQGGSGSGLAIKIYSASDIGSSEAVTIGAAGAGGGTTNPGYDGSPGVLIAFEFY